MTGVPDIIIGGTVTETFTFKRFIEMLAAAVAERPRYAEMYVRRIEIVAVNPDSDHGLLANEHGIQDITVAYRKLVPAENADKILNKAIQKIIKHTGVEEW